MSYTIKLRQDFPIGNSFLSAGRYKVPEQISQKMAEQAMRDGYADKALPLLSLKGRKKRKRSSASQPARA